MGNNEDEVESCVLRLWDLIESGKPDESIEYLLRHPIVYLNKNPAPLLHSLAHARQLSLLRVANLEGINERHPFGGKTPLHYAVFEANASSIPTIEFLLENGADTSIMCKFGFTPLGTACLFRIPKPIIQYLYSKGAIVDLMAAYHFDNEREIAEVTRPENLANYPDTALATVYSLALDDYEGRRHAQSLAQLLKTTLNERGFDFGSLELRLPS